MRLRRGTVHLISTSFAIALLSMASLQAHHSFAPYEPTLQIKLSGVITDFKWGNPHVYLGLDAPDVKTGE